MSQMKKNKELDYELSDVDGDSLWKLFSAPG